MIPPADDPPDLGIPPNRGPLPVGETLTLNLTLAFVPAIDAMPGRRGFGGSELTELCEILDVFFYFYCFVLYLFLAFYRENLRSFPRKSPTTVSFRTSSCDKRCFLQLTTLPI